MANPDRPNWKAMKWLLRYMKFIENEGLIYKSDHKDIELLGFMNSDYVGNRDNMKSTSCYAW